MALSQYVAINFLTKFDKKGLERATKELKGFDKVVASGAFRLRAFAKAGGVAAAAGLTIFTKRAIDAALAQERLDKSLQLTLSSIGQGALASEITSFIQSLQTTTNVTEDQLVPAFQQLVAQTGEQLRAAVAAEREVCAQMVERLGQEGYGTLAIAAALRQGDKS